MTTGERQAQSTPSFIDEAEALYDKDPIKAAHSLWKGVTELQKRHATQGKGPPDTTQQDIAFACRQLSHTDQEATRGIPPEPDEWKMDLAIARNAVRLIEQRHG